MLTRAIMSDETLLGYALFLAMIASAVLVLAGLGVFAYSEGAQGQAVHQIEAGPLSLRGRAPTPTTITLSATGAMLVNANPFPREEVDLVFAEMLQRTPVPPLIIRCGRNVPQGDMLEILAKARAASVQDVRLVVARVGERE